MAGWHRGEDCPPLPTPVVVKGMRLPGVSVLSVVAQCQWWVVAQWQARWHSGWHSVSGGWWHSGKAQWEGRKDAARSRLPV